MAHGMNFKGQNLKLEVDDQQTLQRKRRNAQNAFEHAHGPHRPAVNVRVPRTLAKRSPPVAGIKREMHEEIARMAGRERELEQALADLQKKISSQPHPLLVRASNNVPRLGQDDGNNFTGNANSPSHTPDDDADELTKTLGMMSLKHNPFHGGTATSEHLINMEFGGANRHHMDNGALVHALPNPLSLTSELVLYRVFFPLSPDDQPPPNMDGFLQYLPGYDRACVLMKYYLSYFSWAAMPVPIRDLENIFAQFYPGDVRTDGLTPSDAHKLGVFFMVLTLGTLYDTEQDASQLTTQTKQYYSLANAALAADSVTENTTLHGIQAIMLMIWYLRLFPGIESLSYQWPLLGLLSKLLQAIGLHRNNATNIQSQHIPSDDQRKPHGQTFWEFVSVDVWQSWMIGRSTSISMFEVDCELPSVVDVPNGLAPSFYTWKYSFSRVISDVIARVSGTTEGMAVGKTHFIPALYTDILVLEKRLDEHYVPEDLVWPAPGEPLPRDEVVGRTFQRFLVYVWRNIAMMYLHKQYFYHTVSKFSYDPTKSPYWHSVEVAHCKATRHISDIRRLWLDHPRIINRMYSFWSHLQSAAVVLGALVTKSPGCQFATDALHHLDQACDLFLNAKNSIQPPNALPHLLGVQRKAHQAFKLFHDTSSQFATP